MALSLFPRQSNRTRFPRETAPVNFGVSTAIRENAWTGPSSLRLVDSPAHQLVFLVKQGYGLCERSRACSSRMMVVSKRNDIISKAAQRIRENLSRQVHGLVKLRCQNCRT